MKRVIIGFTLICILPLFSQAPLKPISQSNQEFSFSSFDLLDKKGSNLAFSPFSIQSCLFMLYMGAQDLTAQQMHRALFVPTKQKLLSDLYRKSYQGLMQPHKIKDKKSFLSANGIWVDNKWPILPVFRFMIQKNFYSSVENINFAEQDAAIVQINDWTSQKTQKKIKKIVNKDLVSSAVRMLLINASYFKDEWKFPFAANQTYLEPFYFNANLTSSSHVEMMHGIETLPYYEDTEKQALIMPFKEELIPSSVICVIVLPNLSKLEIDKVAFSELIEGMEEKKVEITLPKFSIQSQLDLKPLLMQLGMLKPFTNAANFSRISGTNSLYVSSALHHCVFSIAELGVEAAAATSASLLLKGMEKKVEKVFKANHPFMFFLYDMDQKLILFMGSYKIPTGAA